MTDALTASHPQRRCLSDYGTIAAEYYDPVLHPTCANFREGSAIILSRWLSELTETNRTFCEVGAGASLLLELLEKHHISIARCVISDRSDGMLSNSVSHSPRSALWLVADARTMPVQRSSFDVVVSSLGDPYNCHDFWGEASRVLRPRGRVFFTVPSHTWAEQFRSAGPEAYAAEFVTKDGRVVWVPSFVYSPTEQRRMVETHGLRIVEHATVSTADLVSPRLSPKLRPGSVVDGYVVEKF